MNQNTGTPELKWYHIRRTRLTAEYGGGLLAGLGLGLLSGSRLLALANDLSHSLPVVDHVLLSFFMIGVGSWIAGAAQRRQRAAKDSIAGHSQKGMA